MKIGILTLPLNSNYGGVLQAYALQTVLKRMGHDVLEVELKKNLRWQYPPLWKIPLSFGKRFLFKYIVRRKNQKILLERYERKIYPLLVHDILEFISKYIKQFKVDKFIDCKGKFDAFVCGSDQIWRYKYYLFFEGDIANVYLKFLGDDSCKRIAYAASFGTDNWEYPAKETAECKNWIQKFDAVSVREETGVKLCSTYYDIKAKHVLDPTMLLSKDDYVDLIEKSDVPKSKGNLFCYILDNTDEKMNVVKNIEKQRHLSPFFMNGDCGNWTEDLEKRIQPPVESWLRAFYDSEFIVTDSFHACVFSILFHKQFLVIGNKERGLARIYSLLSMFGLEDRLTSDTGLDINRMKTIDYDRVDEILAKHREESRTFLIQALTS
ncbi:polysaccharide pyruvyl transferase family protein [Segatella copri]|uniref:Polysaccharide pyruvyl transferase family protein n=1 Tax=Segatella copri TaxID=165179 RepID=A0AAW5V175_9BACT|nr:polysaccharide pyruvyl transferase family protein [Segatella copri]MCW4141970.1 polysaccharide pyruvyl transferase family protein [Segatella copri]MCW4147884.1 polysaccharide pyruvyl transferase family protein [Segatella copri]MCW4166494.1 polysaccharide pyruvyl transferase family protein [Segatella copri]